MSDMSRMTDLMTDPTRTGRTVEQKLKIKVIWDNLSPMWEDACRRGQLCLIETTHYFNNIGCARLSLFLFTFSAAARGALSRSRLATVNFLLTFHEINKRRFACEFSLRLSLTIAKPGVQMRQG